MAKKLTPPSKFHHGVTLMGAFHASEQREALCAD